MMEDASFKFRKEKGRRKKRRKERGGEGRKEEGKKKLFQILCKELYNSNTEPYFL